MGLLVVYFPTALPAFSYPSAFWGPKMETIRGAGGEGLNVVPGSSPGEHVPSLEPALRSHGFVETPPPLLPRCPYPFELTTEQVWLVNKAWRA